MVKPLSERRLFGLIEKWGARRISTLQWEADLAGNCQAPVRVTIRSVPLRRGRTRVWSRGKEAPVWLFADTPCRRCARCLARRAKHWQLRAVTEASKASRTWLGTLTFNPASHYLHVSRARAHLAKQGLDYDGLDRDDQFGELHRQCSREITLAIKRLRKLSKARFRYLIVAEAHQSGLPHYHVMMHERTPEQPLLYRQLQASWKAGFSAWKLVADRRGLTYAAKYLGKDARARVRASVKYGSPL